LSPNRCTAKIYIFSTNTSFELNNEINDGQEWAKVREEAQNNRAVCCSVDSSESTEEL
jgi:hypothetical protein